MRLSIIVPRNEIPEPVAVRNLRMVTAPYPTLLTRAYGLRRLPGMGDIDDGILASIVYLQEEDDDVVQEYEGFHSFRLLTEILLGEVTWLRGDPWVVANDPQLPRTVYMVCMNRLLASTDLPKIAEAIPGIKSGAHILADLGREHLLPPSSSTYVTLVIPSVAERVGTAGMLWLANLASVKAVIAFVQVP